LALRVPDSLDFDVQNIITFYDGKLLYMFVNVSRLSEECV